MEIFEERHTNLSSAVQRAKALAKEKGKPHFAHGSSGRYRVTEKRPEDTSFIQATPSGGEWSHKMNANTHDFTKSRISNGVSVEAVEREWGNGLMSKLIGRLEEREASGVVIIRLKDAISEINAVIKDISGERYVEAAQGLQDVLDRLASAVHGGFGIKSQPTNDAFDAILKAKKAVFKMEMALAQAKKDMP